MKHRLITECDNAWLAYQHALAHHAPVEEQDRLLREWSASHLRLLFFSKQADIPPELMRDIPMKTQETARIASQSGHTEQCFHRYIDSRIRNEPAEVFMESFHEWHKAYDELMRALETLHSGRNKQ